MSGAFPAGSMRADIYKYLRQTINSSRAAEMTVEIANAIKQPRVGVAAIVLREGKVLMGKRKGAHGPGTWSFPGGKLDFGEDVSQCAMRETWEEAGISIRRLRNPTFTNDHFKAEDLHFITLYLTADWREGEPVVKEPAKCDIWDWFPWDNLPQPLFLPVQNLLRQGFRPE